MWPACVFMSPPALWESRCNWCRTLGAWSLTGWTGSGSSRRPASWASYRWRASRASCSDSYSPWTSAAHSYHPAPEITVVWYTSGIYFWLIFNGMNWNIIKTLPELQMWNTSWDSWWSWRGRAVWCRGFSWGLRDTWCRWCCGE